MVCHDEMFDVLYVNFAELAVVWLVAVNEQMLRVVWRSRQSER